MPCYHPLRAFKAGLKANGKLDLSWSRKGTEGEEVFLPCGQCIGCRLERSRQWAVRCMHEADLHEANCFLTLTYDEAHLPKGGSLVLKDFQDFMKRLRKRVGGGIRFYHCGEYGDEGLRPHYHCLVFGYDFPDKVLLKEANGVRLYVSEMLSETWGKGFATIGALTFESAAYVARYCLKKITGDAAEAHYGGRAPEYTTMSRRPGIGRGWFDLYHSEVYPSDEVIARGRSCRPPKYYDNLLDKLDSAMLESVKMIREREGKRGSLVRVERLWNGERFAPGYVVIPSSDSRRLSEMEAVKKASLRTLKRGLE